MNNKLEGYDGYFYFNADSDISKMTETCINDIKNALDNDLVICSWHGTSYLNIMNIINNKNNNYKQGAFFGANENIFYLLCSDVVKKVNTYLINNKIPEWHDETVLNEVLNEGNYKLLYKPFLIMARLIKNFDELFKVFKQTSPYLFITIQKDMKYKAKKLRY